MKYSLKTAFSIIAGVCLLAVMLGGCAKTGQMAPGQNGINDFTPQNQGFGTTNLYGGTSGNMAGTGTGMNFGFGTTTMPNAGTNMAQNTGSALLPGAGNFPGTGPNTGLGLGRTSGNITDADRRKADAIKRQVLGIRGVTAADVIVMGNTALVGIRTAGAGNSAALRSSIDKRVRSMDTTIKRVAVSDSSDILARMRRLGAGTTTGMTGTTGGGTMNISEEFRRLVDGV